MSAAMIPVLPTASICAPELPVGCAFVGDGGVADGLLVPDCSDPVPVAVGLRVKVPLVCVGAPVPVG